VPVIKRSFLLMPFTVGMYQLVTDTSVVVADPKRTQSHMVLQTLSHFSLAASRSELLLLDPCLIDKRLITGLQQYELVSKTGPKKRDRIMRFIRDHRCNEHCKQLQLPSVKELILECQNSYGTERQGLVPSTRGDGPPGSRSPRGGVGISCPGVESGGIGGGRTTVTLRTQTAAILDHPHPDMDELLASRPFSHFRDHAKFVHKDSTNILPPAQMSHSTKQQVPLVTNTAEVEALDPSMVSPARPSAAREAAAETRAVDPGVFECYFPAHEQIPATDSHWRSPGITAHSPLESNSNVQVGNGDLVAEGQSPSVLSRSLREMSQVSLAQDALPRSAHAAHGESPEDQKAHRRSPSPRTLEMRQKARERKAREEARLTHMLTTPPTLPPRSRSAMSSLLG